MLTNKFYLLDFVITVTIPPKIKPKVPSHGFTADHHGFKGD